MSYPLRFPTEKPLVTLTHRTLPLGKQRGFNLDIHTCLATASIWIIELHNGPDSRLSTALINDGLQPALDAVERDWRNGWRAARAAKNKTGGKGALIIVGNRGQDKFFSNGLDFDSLSKDPHYSLNFFPHVYNPLMRRLITFPIPTIAAINGHCFAGAMMLSLCCDYRVITDGGKRNVWMCMNEIHLGAGFPQSFTSLIRAKIPDARTHRKVILEGHRFSPSEALEAGLVDHTVNGDTEAVIAKAQQVADTVSSLCIPGSWGISKRELYRDVIEASTKDTVIANVPADDAVAKAKL
ncbi:unnamed protein product [Somion occarium]|uniref:ClpP/crotonase n=1 Tax=Somion occarium TaxID=3059160 RepID=A0ABP1E9U9_9APHY